MFHLLLYRTCNVTHAIILLFIFFSSFFLTINLIIVVLIKCIMNNYIISIYSEQQLATGLWNHDQRTCNIPYYFIPIIRNYYKSLNSKSIWPPSNMEHLIFPKKWHAWNTPLPMNIFHIKIMLYFIMEIE